MKRIINTVIGLFGVLAVTAGMSVFVMQTVPVQTVAADHCPSDDYTHDSSGGCVARARNTCNSVPLNANDCPFLRDYVVPAINALAASVGIVVVIMVAWGGFQYTTSRDNPQQSAAAKEHIRNALIALVVYIFMIAFLNWLVPGGVF